MSVETIAVVISAAALLLSLGAGFAWMIRRTDAQFAAQFARVDEQFARVDAQFARQREITDARFDEVQRELTDIKIAIARIEGPERRLVTAR